MEGGRCSGRHRRIDFCHCLKKEKKEKLLRVELLYAASIRHFVPHRAQNVSEKASEKELMEKQIEIFHCMEISRVLTAARRWEPRPGANPRT